MTRGGAKKEDGSRVFFLPPPHSKHRGKKKKDKDAQEQGLKKASGGDGGCREREREGDRHQEEEEEAKRGAGDTSRALPYCYICPCASRLMSFFDALLGHPNDAPVQLNSVKPRVTRFKEMFSSCKTCALLVARLQKKKERLPPPSLSLF